MAALLIAVFPHVGRMPSEPLEIVADNPPEPVPAPADESRVATAPSAPIDLGVYDPGSEFAGVGGLGIEHVYVYWQQLDREMLRAKIDYARARGRRMLITVEPYTKASDWRSGGNHLFSDIVAGGFDAEIASVCSEVAEAGEGTIVRWGHEMEQPQARYPWARNDAKGYKSAYRYFVEQCRTHAPQAQYMWSPKGERNLADFYPGDRWVDVVGLSIYGLQKWDHKYHKRDRSFAEVVAEKYDRVTRFGKPVALAEFGVSGSEAYRQSWLEDSARQVSMFPRLSAIVYFNAKEPASWPAGLGSPDWRVVPASLIADL